MPTSVHIPKPLLEAVDRRARALKMSRNRLIMQALERELAQSKDWSPEFFAQLADAPAIVRSAVEEMEEAIEKGRLSKSPVRL